MSDCKHSECRAEARVCVFADREDDGSADITIVCAGCGARAEWKGLDTGVSFVGPMVDVEGLTLRAPFAFKQPGEATGLIGAMTGGRH